MRLRSFFAATTVSVASLPGQPALAVAQEERPIVIEYVAPTPECASSEAFQTLLKTEIARFPSSDRDWRFSVRIVRQDGLYAGTLKTETGGVRTITAIRCEDVTAALAVIIAVAEPSLPPAGEQAPPPAAASPPSPSPVQVELPERDERGLERAGEASKLVWRVGGRGFVSNHPSWAYPNLGGMGALSLELPWGFRKMMFEVGVGLSQHDGSAPLTPSFSVTGSLTPSFLVLTSISYVIFDTQACLLDLPIENTGLSVLGCLRLAGATFRTTATFFVPMGGTNPMDSGGGAFWSGASARLRWQTPVRLFVEGNVDAMYGTVSGGEDNTPGWFGVGLGVGLQI